MGYSPRGHKELGATERLSTQHGSKLGRGEECLWMGLGSDGWRLHSELGLGIKCENKNLQS